MPSITNRSFDLLDLISQLEIDIQRAIGIGLFLGFSETKRRIALIDVLSDTTKALMAFEAAPALSCEPSQYLQIYGVLQAIVVQQNALLTLGKSIGFKLNVADDAETARFRNIRHVVAGHPGSREGCCFIDRGSLSDHSFDMLECFSDGTSIKQTIFPGEAISAQFRFASNAIQQFRNAIEAQIQQVRVY